ncbi:hypothetical protein [Sediminivirga luteola]|uniref:Uncharacterized protein n=1 Tax=Sediminivirga luteola TaxID=1774748 RepID=A0A8J2U0A7_9MICO|nr:hypothetical protein [Sediminivirga luteola]GGA23939.1 hypothetical protein GCM10011333_28720 [Sediminivirga luteola]
MRRLLSLLIAVPLSLLALPALWTVDPARIGAQLAGGPPLLDPFAAVLGILGVLLLAAAAASAALSSLGALVAGAIHVLAGLVLFAVPPGQRYPVVIDASGTFGTGGAMDRGMLEYTVSGSWIMVGVLLLAAAGAAKLRRPAAPPPALMAVLTLGGFLVISAGVVLGLLAPEGVTRAFATLLFEGFALPVLGILAGALLAGGGVLASIWTRLPLWLAGAVLLVLGLVFVFMPWLPFGFGLRSAAWVFLPLWGGVILGAAAGVQFRRRAVPGGPAPSRTAAPQA